MKFVEKTNKENVLSIIAILFTFQLKVVIMLQVNYFFMNGSSYLIAMIRRIIRLWSKSSHRPLQMLEEITAKRDHMIDCAIKLGFTNEKTIELSQELDVLINEYQRNLDATFLKKKARNTLKKTVLLISASSLVKI